VSSTGSPLPQPCVRSPGRAYGCDRAAGPDRPGGGGPVVCCGRRLCGRHRGSHRQRAGRWQGEAVIVDLRHAPVEGDHLVRQRERYCHGEVGMDHAEFAGGHGQTGLATATQCVAAVRAAELHAMPRPTARRVQVGPVSSSRGIRCGGRWWRAGIPRESASGWWPASWPSDSRLLVPAAPQLGASDAQWSCVTPPVPTRWRAGVRFRVSGRVSRLRSAGPRRSRARRRRPRWVRAARLGCGCWSPREWRRWAASWLGAAGW
jgi:hypothetical protein